MTAKRLRNRIAFVAARLLHDQQETEYVQAKRRAARKLGFRFRPTDLPSNREVRDQLRQITEIFERSLPEGHPRRLRVEALRWMGLLARFHPRLVGNVASGSTEPGTAIDLLLLSDDPEPVLAAVEPQTRKFEWLDDAQSTGAYGALVVAETPVCRLHLFRSEEQDKRPPGITAEELSTLLDEELPDGDLERELQGLDPNANRFEIYRDLLAMLEDVDQDPETHPEGDALYHSLQAFDLAVQAKGYDEEFVTAALLHDVGKTVSETDHTEESIALLDGIVTHRTRWLIAHYPLGHLYRSGELSVDERRLLEESPDFDDLMLLCELDENARRSGVETSTPDEAIEYLQRLDAEDYDWD